MFPQKATDTADVPTITGAVDGGDSSHRPAFCNRCSHMMEEINRFDKAFSQVLCRRWSRLVKHTNQNHITSESTPAAQTALQLEPGAGAYKHLDTNMAPEAFTPVNTGLSKSQGKVFGPVVHTPRQPPQFPSPEPKDPPDSAGGGSDRQGSVVEKSVIGQNGRFSPTHSPPSEEKKPKKCTDTPSLLLHKFKIMPVPSQWMRQSESGKRNNDRSDEPNDSADPDDDTKRAKTQTCTAPSGLEGQECQGLVASLLDLPSEQQQFVVRQVLDQQCHKI